jgi:hypothetical protein
MAHELREEWLGLPPQLMVQMYVLVLTLEEVIKVAPNYYAQRLPAHSTHRDHFVQTIVITHSK